VSFSADGRRLVSADTGGQLIVWDAATGQALHSHRFPGPTFCAAFAPDGRSIAAGTERAVCYVMELPEEVQ
jgi:hypothetical protein